MNLLSIKDIDKESVYSLFKETENLKANPLLYSEKIKGMNFALIFEKPSVRTRVSFEAGINQMGGNSIYLEGKNIGIGKREPVKDIARVLSGYVDGIIARTFSHEVITELGKYSSVPVINGLSDLEHPCQVLADMFTLKEKLLDFKKMNFMYVGDGNNVLNSLLLICSKLGINFYIAIPKQYMPSEAMLKLAEEYCLESRGSINIVPNPADVSGMDVIYTDVWTSMGQENESEKRKKDFSGFQVNMQMLKKTGKNPLVMHCLPAHRDQEITDEVMESENSIVFSQAENRMHVQKSILLWCMDIS